MLISILAFIILITILVFVHEMGHYIAARSVGIRVEKFYVGFNFFGLGIKKIVNGIEYGIGLFPIGGYVKVSGIIDESFDDQYEFKDYEYGSKNTFEKLWFTSGGVIFNFILAILIFFGLNLFRGTPEVDSTNMIGGVYEGYPADSLGIKADNKIVKIDGGIINSWDDITNSVRSNPNKIVSIEWIDDQQIKSDIIQIKSTRDEFDNQIGIIGITPKVNYVYEGIFSSLMSALDETLNWMQRIGVNIIGLFSGKMNLESFGGPLLIAKIAGDSLSVNLSSFFQLMAIISINLGIINILPFPGLDGGHALIAIIEGVIGRRIPTKTLILIQWIGITLLMILFFIIIKNDISTILSL